EPELVEIARPGVHAGGAERVEVAFARPLPVLEGDGELEAAGHRLHELALVDLQQAVEGADRGDGGLAHAHGTDLLRFDQRDLQQVAELVGQRAGRHPACGPAASDHHLADPVVVQDSPPPLRWPPGPRWADACAIPWRPDPPTRRGQRLSLLIRAARMRRA